MLGVSTFLESSTIHGLNYISTTRKFVRLFWILVVISGFITAAFLIKESFDSWSDSPIKTTFETFPISELTLPKLTVCPPKNTFTDLNYYLMMTENNTLTEKMRDELFKYAVEVSNEGSFSLNSWKKLHEEDRFFIWYYGYTEIRSPNTDDRCNVYRFCYDVCYDVSTSATSGVVTTQHYGEKFRSDLVEKKLFYQITIFPPQDTNIVLHFKVEKISMTELAGDSIDKADIIINQDGLIINLDADQTIAYTNFTILNSNDIKAVHLTRSVSSGDVEQQKLDVMPGFRLQWWYTGAAEAVPDPNYKDEKLTKHFVRCEF